MRTRHAAQEKERMRTMTTSPENEAVKPVSELHLLIRALEESESKPGGRSVLVVDDEPSVRRMVSRSMKGLDPNLNVHQAENGQEALTQLASIREKEGADPALIVTDLQMPVMDGWEFIDRLWKQCQEQGRDFGIPVIVLSASSGEKGILFGKSVHGGRCKYRPLVAIAKEDCIKPLKYDTQGGKGLAAWLQFFLRKRE
jgi:CheY-like chemotaxis protein